MKLRRTSDWTSASKADERRISMTERAFSLLEHTIATSIAAIIFAAVFSGISNGFAILQTSREGLRATQIALSRMEGLRLCAWDNDQLFNTAIVPVRFVDYYYPVGINNNYGSNVVYNGTMTVTTNIGLSPAPTYASKMALVTVTVTWTNVHYGVVNVHQRTVRTYVSKHGVQNYVYSH